MEHFLVRKNSNANSVIFRHEKGNLSTSKHIQEDMDTTSRPDWKSQWRRPDIFIAIFEHVSHFVLMFILMTLIMYLIAGVAEYNTP